MRLARAAGGLGLGFAVACGGSGSGALPIGDADKAVLVTADDLLDLAAIDRTKEKWSKARSFDGSTELSYEYEADAFYLNCTANYETDADSAGYVYTGATIGLDVVGAAYGDEAQFVEDPSVMTWGDERTCKQLTMQGLNLGTMCVARKDRRVYTVMVAGQAFSGDGAVDAFLADELAAFETWAP